jgi:aryl-alcohol dehydrogenase-like predicted oxidoreductase
LVSEIGFGTWGISGRGYGPTDDTESIRTLHKALDLGVNFIDTADSYGDGHSEELIGKVLKERGDKETIIATKFGWDFYGRGGIRSNLRRDYISFALEQSLKRLRRDRIDIYQIHNSKPDAIKKHGVYETLDELKKQGRSGFMEFPLFT